MTRERAGRSIFLGEGLSQGLRLLGTGPLTDGTLALTLSAPPLPARLRRSAARQAIAAGRRARLAEAYVQLLAWQSDMVAAGIRHDAVTLRHLLGALERVNAVSDCIQLAHLHEKLRPGGGWLGCLRGWGGMREGQESPWHGLRPRRRCH
jgi:hypothetical protein